MGTLVLLRIGDIWCNQRLALRPDYELETFENVEVGTATNFVVKAGHSQSDGFLLPLGSHPLHRQNTHSFCIVVALKGGLQLAIPCAELIRFYFGSSSGLLSKLFLPPLERRALYHDAVFDRFSGRLRLKLAHNIAGSSAADIGRLDLDPIAWRAACQIGVSLLKASMAKEGIFPRAFFPFIGKTTLVASGKWLPSNDKERATFIVFHLRSCSYAFPFRTLRYETSGYQTPARTGGPAQANQRATDTRRAPQDSVNQKLVEQDASNELTPKSKPFQLEQRFPDLRNKPVWKNKAFVADGNAQAVSLKGAPPVDTAAIGLPGSGERIRPVELMALASPESEQHAAPPAFLQSVVDELMQLRGIDVDLLTRSDDNGWTLPVTVIADDDGVIDEALFINDSIGDGVGVSRLRRIAVFALKCNGEHASLVVIESSPLHMKLYATAGHDPDEVWRTIGGASNDFICRQEPMVAGLAGEINWLFETVQFE